MNPKKFVRALKEITQQIGRTTSTPGGVSNEELLFLKNHLPSKQVARFLRNSEHVLQIVDQESFYPEMPRKERRERILDQMIWRDKHGHYNNAYNEYGLDIVGFRDADDYLDRYEFREAKSFIHHGNIDPQRYEMMSINKMWFYSYMEAVAPGLTPKMHLVFRYGTVYLPYNVYPRVRDALNELPVGTYACKLLSGEKGKGFFKVVKDSSGKIVFNDGEDDMKSFLAAVKRGSYLLQDYAVQHPAISALTPHSVNTVRIATLRYGKKAHVFYALLRMSSRADSQVDNASQGGTFVGIDAATGKLKKYGFYDDDINYVNKIETRHPVTGTVYEDHQIPYWNEIVKMVTDLHQYFRGLVLIGWDIAVTENGPVILEINSNPCSKMAQIANGGLQKKWDELKVAP